METKYFVDISGNYIGGYSGAEPPVGAIEVPTAPDRASDIWVGGVWTPSPAQLLADKAAVLKTFVSLRVTIVSVLAAIAGRMQRAGDMTSALACDVASTSFIGIENTPAFIAAPDAPTAQAVILIAYQTIAATLNASSPTAAAEFVAMGLTYP